MNELKNSFSVDVEEYFHANNLERVAPPRVWCRQPSRVERSTEQLLEVFDRYSVKATFFILGYVARRHPELVRDITTRGHEIASHGYAHRLAYTQTPKQFYRDVLRARRLLEDLSGKPVLGYRAPSFSIRSDNSWAYDCLIQAGYIYDSSLFPIRHPRYGNRQQSTAPTVLERPGGSLFVMPLAVRTIQLLGREIRLPAAGGAYWRVLPRRYNRWALAGLRHISLASGRPAGFNCYVHPWEIDPEQPVFHQLSFLTRLRHYGGAKTFLNTIEYFLQSFRFTTVADAAADVFGQDFERARMNR
ncbi:MAG: XrtA system polysaccharide deacetylase [Bdellovibrionota bacterium]